jgi:hypothetical protein
MSTDLIRNAVSIKLYRLGIIKAQNSEAESPAAGWVAPGLSFLASLARPLLIAHGGISTRRRRRRVVHDDKDY